MNQVFPLLLSAGYTLFLIVGIATISFSLSTVDSLAGNWKFNTSEEDWGLTCFAETITGAGSKFGLMGSSGHEVVVYISSDTQKIPASGRDRKSTRLNSSHPSISRMPSSA